MSPPTTITCDDVLADPLRDAVGATSRWLLIGRGEGVAPAEDAARRALAGGERVFGLAGVVLVDAPDGAGDALPPDLPRLDVSADDDVDAVVADFWQRWAGRGPDLSADLIGLLASDRVSARTRAAHARRILAVDPDYRPQALTPDHLTTLRAVADRVVPQPGEPHEWIDLAARVDGQLALGIGDGWRQADQPDDVTAYRRRLDALASFADLPTEGQDDALRRLAEADDPWFEDCRTDLVRCWLAHPASMARVGYDGFADSGDHPADQGFADLAAGAREAWEPLSIVQVSGR